MDDLDRRRREAVGQTCQHGTRRQRDFGRGPEQDRAAAAFARRFCDDLHELAIGRRNAERVLTADPVEGKSAQRFHIGL